MYDRSRSRLLALSCRGSALIAIILFIGMVCMGAAAPTTSTVTLASSSNPVVVFGQPLTLTATVSSTSATGKVTFYDGVTILGIATLSSGQATLTTTLLPTGKRSLKA